MTAPLTPALPAAPKGTPAWLIKTVSLLVLLAGPFLAWVDPTGKIDTPTAQAVVIVAFLVVAAAIFLVHVALAAVHEYGWSRAALGQIGSADLAELKTLWPEIQSAYATAKPALDQVQAVSGAINAISTRVDQVEGAVKAIPDPAAVEAIVRSVVIPGVQIPPASPAGVAPAGSPAGG
jgi:hypothetical protein